jgi:hypothetical protein
MQRAPPLVVASAIQGLVILPAPTGMVGSIVPLVATS